MSIDVPETTRKDWMSDQEVRWCPGCGDYSILAAVQLALPDMGLRREEVVFVSGIGCAARFPYYMNTYGMHSIHGRAPAIATGLAMARPDLHVFVVSGDGDALSIGGNHLIHALRRNINITILLFNNQIYGLTKGQYSPTSEVGKVTKSTPFGSIDRPFNPISVALGAEASFVARTHDMDRAHMIEMFTRAHAHQGTSIIEIYQNCNVFNDGAFGQITAKDARDQMLIPLVHGQPIRFGAEAERGVVLDGGGLRIADVADVGEDALLVHDETREDPSIAFMLSRLARGPYEPTPVGRVPLRGPSRVRQQRQPAAGGGARRQGPRRPRRPVAVRCHLGRRLGRRDHHRVAHGDPSRRTHHRSDAEAAGAFSGHGLEDRLVAVEARLWSGDDHAAVDLLHHPQPDPTDDDVGVDQRSLVAGPDDHVGSEPSDVPGPERILGHDRDAGAAWSRATRPWARATGSTRSQDVIVLGDLVVASLAGAGERSTTRDPASRTGRRRLR